MGVCISGHDGDFAPIVLLTRDDSDSQLIAKEFLSDVKIVHSIRNMHGLSGTYGGYPVSIQGLGVGGVSASIYVEELAREFAPKYFIKLDGCIALRKEVGLGDFVFAQTAHTTSKINRYRYGGKVFPAAAHFPLLNAYYEQALQKRIRPHVGAVVSIDTRAEMPLAFEFAKRGALSLDLEMSQVLTVASLYGISAVGILRAFKHAVTGEALTENDMQTQYLELVHFVLEGLHLLPK